MGEFKKKVIESEEKLYEVRLQSLETLYLQIFAPNPEIAETLALQAVSRSLTPYDEFESFTTEWEVDGIREKSKPRNLS